MGRVRDEYETDEPTKKYKNTFLIILSIWLAASLIAPFTVQSNSVNDLSGRASFIDNEKVWGNMNPFAATVYFLGDIFCAGDIGPFILSERKSDPFCARCTAINVGALIDMLIAPYYNPIFNLVLLTLGVLPMVVYGGMELVSSYRSTNLLRVITDSLSRSRSPIRCAAEIQE